MAFQAQAKELILWSHLSHVNVLPFHGVFYSGEELPRICIISPWMKNGDLEYFLKTSPKTPKVPLVSIPDIQAPRVILTRCLRFWILSLAYNIYTTMELYTEILRRYGALSSSYENAQSSEQKNILISNDKRAMIADFGISSVAMTVASTKRNAGGTVKWMAPELLIKDNARGTIQSDIWSFACVCYEVL
jgi:serine/threonine protein kinase